MEGDDAMFMGLWTRWMCPHCDESNEDEGDVRGEEVKCPACGESSTVSN
jgi:hypothetical protein